MQFDNMPSSVESNMQLHNILYSVDMTVYDSMPSLIDNKLTFYNMQSSVDSNVWFDNISSSVDSNVQFDNVLETWQYVIFSR